MPATACSPGSPRAAWADNSPSAWFWERCGAPASGQRSVRRPCWPRSGKDIPAVAAVMLAFGLGAATPLLLISTLSRTALTRWRRRMARAGQAGKMLLGGGAVVVSLLILTGLDRQVEAVLVNASPLAG